MGVLNMWYFSYWINDGLFTMDKIIKLKEPFLPIKRKNPMDLCTNEKRHFGVNPIKTVQWANWLFRAMFPKIEGKEL